MKCIIVDDEAMARLIINQFCEKLENLEVVEQFPNAMQAIKYLNANEVDLIFLDVHMPDFTGFDFIQTLKNPPKVILTTSDEKSALEAFEYDCIVDFLVKPMALPRFVKAIQKVEKLIENTQLTENQSKTIVAEKETFSTENTNTDLYVNIDRRLVKIDIPSIYLIEAKGDYIQIKTESKNHIVHSTLKKIEEKLPQDVFFKVHRSYIININKIIDIEDNSVLIKKDVIPVSRSNRPELMKRINLL